MDYLIQFQIHILSLFILLTLFYILRMSKVLSYGKKIIYWMIMAAALGIISEPLAWMFEKTSLPGGFYLEYISNFLLFLAGPLLMGLTVSYVDFYIFKNAGRIRRRYYYLQGFVFNLFMLIINIFYPVYYYITEDIVYHSAFLNWVHHGVILGIYLYLVFLVANGRGLTYRERFILLLFSSMPIVGVLLQFINVRLFFAWTVPVVGILGIYVFLESSPSDEDYLTKLYSRKSYEVYLEYLMHEKNLKGILLIDLDRFKMINDTYGHRRGDEVLVTYGSILKDIFDTYGMVARLGGDEFAVIFEKGFDDLDRLIGDVNEALKNHEDPLMNELSFSSGWRAYDSEMALSELYTLADRILYEGKNS